MAKDVAKKQEVSKEVAEYAMDNIPDYMKDQVGGQGTEGLSAAALAPPRLKLAQATSPELEEYNLKPGDYFNNITGENYGKEVDIIPCFLSEAYFLFAPRLPGSPGGLLARAMDAIHWNPPNAEFEVVIDKSGKRTKWRTAETVAKSGLDQWGTFDPDNKSSPPAAVHTINVVILMADKPEDGPMVYSFFRSGLKVGKRFAGNLKMSRVPSFGRVMRLTSLKVDGDSGPYLEPRFKPMGFVADVGLFDEARAMYNMAKQKGVEVDITADTEHSGGNGGGTTETDKY